MQLAFTDAPLDAIDLVPALPRYLLPKKVKETLSEILQPEADRVDETQ